ncbi:MAG TPA: homoserine O-acetyltransferase [Flavobacteriales bacterium]|nr:homoserine O-acetyltransferase [Flavobacteriales bacterium]
MKTIEIQKNKNVKVFKPAQAFYLECGGVIPQLEIAYTTFGTLNANKSNVVWVCHALTANANPVEWWPGLVGEGFIIDPAKHFIVCANILGSCYGTTGPLSPNAQRRKKYYSEFPFVTVRDMVNAHVLLADELGIDKIKLLIGGSLGGQQVMEWSIIQPNRIQNQVLLATNAFHSPYGIAFNESQRLAIYADETYAHNTETGGAKGLKAARSIALISYRTYNAYNATQKEEDIQKTDGYNAAGYQQYQGDKLVDRFNAYSYVTLSKAMDSHNVGRNRGSVEEALATIKAKTICIGITSDILFPPVEQQFLQKHIAGATYVEIDSSYGHDGFLIEVKKLTEIIKELL